MSKIGKQPVILPEGVSAEIAGQTVKITGPKGSLTLTLARGIDVEMKDKMLVVTTKGKSKQAMANFGTSRALLNNMVLGVTEGWKKELELVGTGYRAEVNGTTLVLTIGLSHPVKIEAPEGIAFSVEKSIINVAGSDRELVGRVAAQIRAVKPPEPYKGKGIKYLEEVVRRKAGKAAKTVGAPA
jgi:large subunit ribosomal protein L6